MILDLWFAETDKYTKKSSQSFHSFSLFSERYAEGGWSKKWQSVAKKEGDGGVKKCHIASEVLFA